jgi:putative acetyltransferase
MAALIRPECPDDAIVIDDVTRQAFASHPHSRHTEQFIVRALREANALSVSLVAELSGGQVVGHVAFSPVVISDGSDGWYGVGPVSVLPSVQRRGIGRSLMESGLSLLRERGAAGCVLVGEPLFYGRFGFAKEPELVLPGVPPEFFLARPFGSAKPRGEVTFHAAFSADRHGPAQSSTEPGN